MRDLNNAKPDRGMFGHETPEQSPMDDDELLAVIREFEQESYGYTSGSLAEQRAYAIDRYLAMPYGDEIDGRSAVVDTGLRDTVEWVMPQILRVFLAGDQVVKINPTSAEDEEQAKQETDYVNHVILEKNDAFNVLSTWFRDALVTKMGYVKAYWTEQKDIISETYRGITDDQLMMIEGDKDVEIVSKQDYPDQYAMPQPMPQQPGQPPAQGMGAAPTLAMQPGQMPTLPMLHDVKLRRLKTHGFVKIDNVPAEEIRIHRSTRSISVADAIFIRHSARRTISQLRQDGYDIPDDIHDSGEDMGNINDQISISRDRFADDSDLREDLAYIDPAARRVWLHEDYVRVDYDGDGIAELRRVCHIGNQILANEELDLIPIASITPIVFPHRHVGIGYDDLCDMPSKVATAIQRGFLDNLYLQNNGRYGVDVTKVNVDDMLVSRPGGIVRVDGNPGDGIFPFTHPPVGQMAMEGMQWAQQWREVSTGVSPDQSNLSADSLNNVAPGTVAQSVAAGQARVEAVARSFATGVKELFSIVHALTLKNATTDEKMKLNNKWVTIDPREWVKRTGLTITVGLGTGTRESRMMHLTQLAQMQAQGMQIGICQPQNLYHTGELIVQEMGYKNAEEFFSDPAKNPPQPPQPPPQVLVENIKQQGNDKRLQMESQIKAAELQLTDQSKQRELMAQQEVQRSNDQRDMERTQMELALKERTAMEELRLQDIQHQRDMDKEIQLANIRAASAAQVAQIGAGVDDGSQLLRQQEREAGYSEIRQLADKLQQTMTQQMQQTLATPRKVIRNPDGSLSVQHETPKSVQ